MEWHNVNQYHTNMKRNYFFTMLAAVLFAVVESNAQESIKFKRVKPKCRCIC